MNDLGTAWCPKHSRLENVEKTILRTTEQLAVLGSTTGLGWKVLLECGEQVSIVRGRRPA